MSHRQLILLALFALALALLWWLWPRSTAIENPGQEPISQIDTRPNLGKSVPVPGFSGPSGVLWRASGLGRNRPTEGNPEAPMSFTVDRRGQLIVLDQVNDRIVRPGLPDITVPVRAAQDIIVTSKGMAVLDRLGDRKVALLDETGKVVGGLALEGKGIKEGGAVTGLFEDKGKLYAEREHGMLVELGSTSGEASSTRAEIPGRPTRDGRNYLTAGITNRKAGSVYVSAIDQSTGANRFTRQIILPEPIVAIAHLDGDKVGVVHFVVTLAHQNVFFCLSGDDGHTLSQSSLPVSHEPEETFRTFATRDDGGLIQSVVYPDGMEYLIHDCD